LFSIIKVNKVPFLVHSRSYRNGFVTGAVAAAAAIAAKQIVVKLF